MNEFIARAFSPLVAELATLVGILAILGIFGWVVYVVFQVVTLIPRAYGWKKTWEMVIAPLTPPFK